MTPVAADKRSGGGGLLRQRRRRNRGERCRGCRQNERRWGSCCGWRLRWVAGRWSRGAVVAAARTTDRKKKKNRVEGEAGERAGEGSGQNFFLGVRGEGVTGLCVRKRELGLNLCN